VTTARRISASTASLPRILWVAAPPALFFAVLFRIADLGALRTALIPAAPQWLLAATLLTGAFAVNQGALYKGVFAVLGEDVKLGQAVSLSLVMAFGSLALPGGTATGIAYFVSTANERGIGSSRALLASLAYYLFEYGALLPVLLIGMAVLRLRHDLAPAALGALALFYATALGAAGLVVWGFIRPGTVARNLTASAAWLRRTAGWTRRFLMAPAVERFAGEIQEILVLARAESNRALRPLLHAALLQVIALALLDAVFVALGVRLAPAVLVAGYAVGTIFMLVSITPSGAGIVEGAMTVTYASLGVPLEVAASAVVLFRLYTFWLPMIAGFLTVRWMRPARA
jgi:uncharacterized protein (TIRG00374 family)